MSEMILPIGYRRGVGGGSVPRTADGSLVVRVGARDVRLLPGAQTELWDVVLRGERASDRARVLQKAHRAGIEGADGALETLLVRGCAVLVADSATDREVFARGHRFGALRAAEELGGAGQFSVRSTSYGGGDGVALGSLAHSLWRYLPGYPSLLAAATDDGPVRDALGDDPVGELLDAVRALVSIRAGYLDVVDSATRAPRAAASGGLDEDEYRQLVTGLPPEAHVAADAPGVRYRFDGLLGERPAFTVANLSTKLDTFGLGDEVLASLLAEVAYTQYAVAHGRDPVWCFQHAGDAVLAREVFDGLGLNRLDVRHVPADDQPAPGPPGLPVDPVVTSGLDEDDYKLLITGAPNPIKYLVENPETGREVAFDGFLNGACVLTIASAATRLPDPTDDAYLALAREQLAAAQGYPVRWYVQRPDDARQLRDLLDGAGLSQVDVRQES